MSHSLVLPSVESDRSNAANTAPKKWMCLWFLIDILMYWSLDLWLIAEYLLTASGSIWGACSGRGNLQRKMTKFCAEKSFGPWGPKFDHVLCPPGIMSPATRYTRYLSAFTEVYTTPIIGTLGTFGVGPWAQWKGDTGSLLQFFESFDLLIFVCGNGGDSRGFPRERGERYIISDKKNHANLAVMISWASLRVTPSLAGLVST